MYVLKCTDEGLCTSGMYVMCETQSVAANAFKGRGDHLPSQMDEYTYMYAFGCMSEDVYVTGVHVTYVCPQGKYSYMYVKVCIDEKRMCYSYAFRLYLPLVRRPRAKIQEF